jgi:1,4-dihydroxy-2-naphthoyl-CoA hydrolase
MPQPSIWVANPCLDDINQQMQRTLCEHLGIQFIGVNDDSLIACMPIDHRTIQPMNLLNGGASAALAEIVGTTAANHCIDRKNQICVGLDLNINHLRSVSSGYVIATATPFHRGKTTQVWEIKIQRELQKSESIIENRDWHPDGVLQFPLQNEQSLLIAIARLTVFVRKK